MCAMSANKRVRRIPQVPPDERTGRRLSSQKEQQQPKSEQVKPEPAGEDRLDLGNLPELLVKLVESSPYQDAVEYWFRKLEGHTIFEYPGAAKSLELDDYMWKYHRL